MIFKNDNYSKNEFDLLYFIGSIDFGKYVKDRVRLYHYF